MPEQSKFENMDLFASLEAIMKQNTGFYQSDLDIDKEIIAKAAASPHREDKTLLWFCRPSGTHCFRERDVFLKDTAPHNTWRFYMEQTSDRVLAYAIELTGKERGKIKGNLYELDYAKHYERVKEKELPADTVKLIYEHGERVQEDGRYFDGTPDPQLGNGRYPPDSFSTAIPIMSLGSLNALKPYPTTRTRCNRSYRKNGAAGSSFRRGISRRILPLCGTG